MKAAIQKRDEQAGLPEPTGTVQFTPLAGGGGLGRKKEIPPVVRIFASHVASECGPFVAGMIFNTGDIYRTPGLVSLLLTRFYKTDNYVVKAVLAATIEKGSYPTSVAQLRRYADHFFGGGNTVASTPAYQIN